MTYTELWGVWAWAVTGPFASQGRWVMWGNPPRGDWTGTREAAEAEAKRFSIDDWKAEARPYVPTPTLQQVMFHGASSSRTLTKTTDVQARVVKGADGDTSLYLFSDEKMSGGASRRYASLSVEGESILLILDSRDPDAHYGEEVALSGLADAMARAFAHVQAR